MNKQNTCNLKLRMTLNSYLHKVELAISVVYSNCSISRTSFSIPQIFLSPPPPRRKKKKPKKINGPIKSHKTYHVHLKASSHMAKLFPAFFLFSH